MKLNLVKLQKAMAKERQVECPVVHHFADGCYARELLIPAGVCIVGAKHKTNHFFMLVEGECYIADNNNVEHYRAPQLLITQPGAKRAITAITDTVIITFHVTEETDVLKIGDDILENDFEGLPGWKKQLLEVQQ